MPSNIGKRPVRPDDSADNSTKGTWARNNAKWLILTKYEREFEELIAKNRVSVGLPPRPGGTSREELEAKRDRARQRLEQFEAELRFWEEEDEEKDE